jgi:Domain of unknown function (DUF4177)
MVEASQWEYQALSVGSFWSTPKDEDLEALLNELGQDGWEVVSVFAQHSNNKVRVIARRPLTSGSRRRRSWPG